LKIAIVHDWFTTYAGSEKCVESFTNIWPQADVYTLFNFLNPEQKKIIMKDKVPVTSSLQNWRFVKKYYRKLLPLFPYAIEQFDLSNYDLVISSSHAVAKGVLTNSNQLHINYCHTPVRYAWDLTHQYLNESGLSRGVRGLIAKSILHYIRMWDVTASNRVDYFVANSNYIAGRIKKIYRRDSEVIYPPVDTSHFSLQTKKENYYLAASRFVPYKRIDLIVKAFSMMPDKQLIVIGEGPDEDKIKLEASSNIKFLGYQSNEKLREYIQNAKAFIFAADEDFGIMIIEALSCGTPVIAYNRGGAAETIVDNKTGIHFSEQSAVSIKDAVDKFENNLKMFNPVLLSEYARQFDRKVFEEKIKSFVNLKYDEFLTK
jgi:glycosyltransferase involved in cell wall biosynthesis